MNKIDELLEYVRKTNPGMSKEELIYNLGSSEYVRKSLLFSFENTRNTKY